MLLTLFGLNIITQFSEHLFSEFLTIRHQFYTQKENNTVQLEMPLQNWNSLSNKKEIWYNKTYFDIKSIAIKDQSVFILAVEDSFENILKFIQKKIIKQNKKESDKNQHKLKRVVDLFCSYIYMEKSVFHIDNTNELLTEYLASLYIIHRKPSIKPPIF